MKNKQNLSEKEQIQFIYSEVLSYFDGDLTKVNLWFNAPNAMLGEISPIEMIYFGRTNKVYSFVKESRNGNYA